MPDDAVHRMARSSRGMTQVPTTTDPSAAIPKAWLSTPPGRTPSPSKAAPPADAGPPETASAIAIALHLTTSRPAGGARQHEV